MAHAETLDRAMLEDIARQIGERQQNPRQGTRPGVAASSRQTATHLGESFPVWVLDLSATTRGGAKLRELARPTGRWHHQIRRESRAIQFARTKESPGGQTRHVVELVESGLAPAIDEAITWLDRYAKSEATARLLHLPAYFTTVFWLELAGEDKIFLVEAPVAYARAFDQSRLHGASEFLSVLRHLPHVQGAMGTAGRSGADVTAARASTGFVSRLPTRSSAAALGCLVALIALGFFAPNLTWGRPMMFLITLALMLGEFVAFGFCLGRGVAGVIVDSRNCMSLSKFQACAWTILVFSTLLVGASYNLHDSSFQALAINIPHELLEALGISAASLAAAPALLSLKTQQTPSVGALASASLQQVRQGGPSRLANIGSLFTNADRKSADWTDMITGDEVGNCNTADLGKIQQLLVTLFLIGTYSVLIFDGFWTSGKYTGLPKFDQSLVWLMAVSHGSYLAYKAAPHTSAARQDDASLLFG